MLKAMRATHENQELIAKLVHDMGGSTRNLMDDIAYSQELGQELYVVIQGSVLLSTLRVQNCMSRTFFTWWHFVTEEHPSDFTDIERF